MKKYCIAFFMLLVCPMYILGQDEVERRRLGRELVVLVTENGQLKLELDSLKKLSLGPPKGYYVRLEPNMPTTKPFIYPVMPITEDGLNAYAIGSFENPYEAAELSTAIRSSNLIDYKVVFHGDFDPADSTFSRRRPTMWIEN